MRALPSIRYANTLEHAHADTHRAEKSLLLTLASIVMHSADSYRIRTLARFVQLHGNQQLDEVWACRRFGSSHRDTLDGLGGQSQSDDG